MWYLSHRTHPARGGPVHPLPGDSDNFGRRPPSLDGLKALSEAQPSKPIRACRALPPPNCSHHPDAIARWYFRSDQGEVRPWFCDRWDCPDCAPAVAARWGAIIAEAHPQRHVVLTDLGPDPALARSRLRNIVKAIRRGQAHASGHRANAIECEYFAALETNRSGSVHAHLLHRGQSIPQRRLSRLLPAYGAGPVCWLRSIQARQSAQACAHYAAQHLVGAVHSDQVKQGRRIRYSRNFWAGRTTAQVAAQLWPRHPNPETWTLVGPLSADQRRLRALAHELEAIDRSAAYADRRLARALAAGLSEEHLSRAGLVGPPV